MTRKLFWTDPYLCWCETTVAAVRGSVVMLAETVFYAFSGGQESDAGTIGGHPVLEARKLGADIEYQLTSDHALRAGDTVRVEIDGERRHRLMRLHFAAELVLELTYRVRPGIEKIGAHIAADKARVDFASTDNLSPLLPMLAAQAQELIVRDHPVITGFSDEAAQRRYWEVLGFARVACGGTHLRHTGEVGIIGLKRKNIGKGKERIEVFVQDSLPSRQD
jgi:alanyl-tRNA synthetase